ncbi:MAG: DUF2567 domain-containing protein [Mycolicibacterium insubricum]
MFDGKGGTVTEQIQAPRLSPERALLRVVGAQTVLGALLGALWILLAPPVHGVVVLTKTGKRVHAYLGSEADHFFLSATLMLGLVSVLAVVTAVAVWQWRAHRGPAMVLTLVLGSITAAGAAAGVGTVLAWLRYGSLDIDGAPVTPEHKLHFVTEAPSVFFGTQPLQIALTLLLPAVAGALVYAIAAAGSPHDDLGGYPAQKEPDLAPHVIM